DTPVPVLAGSSETREEPTVEIGRLKRGTLVTILDKPYFPPNGTGAWLPIQPAPSEVRYIPADAGRKEGAIAIVAAQNAVPAAGQAAVEEKVAEARRLLQDAADRTTDPYQKSQLLGALQKLSASPPFVSQQPANGATAAEGTGRLVSLPGHVQ